MFVLTQVLGQQSYCPLGCVRGSGTCPSSKNCGVEVEVVSKKYLAFTQDDLSAIYESFTPSVL